MKRETADYLVIGNSTAAVGCVEGIRGIDRESRLMLVAGESCRTYSRPLISYLLAGELVESDMYYRPEGFHGEYGVDARLGVMIEALDPETKTARCADGCRIRFEDALIATGGEPVIPSIEGTDAAGVFTFASWQDCLAIDAFLSGNGGRRGGVSAAVIGGGLIGIKAAEALRARGVRVVVIELQNRILPLMLDEESSGLVASAMQRGGVDVVCGVSVSRILSEGGRVAGLELSGGGSVECEMAVLAAGVRPRTDLVLGTSIEIDRGILVDDGCRTSVPHVYAAGDVAQLRNPVEGESGVLPIFPVACRQGRVAGTNMAGGRAILEPEFARNSVEVFDLPVISIGRATASGAGIKILSRRNKESGACKRIVLENGRVIGAVFVGDIDGAGIFTGLVREGIDVSSIERLLLTDEFGVVSLPAEYRKHVVEGEGIEV